MGIIDYKRDDKGVMLWAQDELTRIRSENRVLRKLVQYLSLSKKPVVEDKTKHLHPFENVILNQFNGEPLPLRKLSGNYNSNAAGISRLVKLGYLRRVGYGTYQKVEQSKDSSR